MSPASLAGLVAGGLFMGAVVLAGFFSWQKRKEEKDARYAKEYYDEWVDDVSVPLFDEDGVALHNQPRHGGVI